MSDALSPTTVSRDAPSGVEIERTADRTWLVGGIFVGLGISPLAGFALYVLSRLFFDYWMAQIVLLAAALLSFALGLAYVALARSLEE